MELTSSMECSSGIHRWAVETDGHNWCMVDLESTIAESVCRL